MSDKLRPVWSEGLFLRPQHFQQQLRYFEHVIDFKTMHVFDNLYGIIDFEIASEFLSQGKISLSHVSGIMPDGTVFVAPNQDYLPEAIDLNGKVFSDTVVYINVPISVKTKSEIDLDGSEHDTKYKLMQAKISDRTTFSSNEAIVDLCSARLSLSIGSQNNEAYISLPLLKVDHVNIDGSIVLDNKFIPTCLNIHSLPYVKIFLEQLSHAIKQHKESIEETFKGFSRTKSLPDLTNFLMLATLKKWLMIFNYLKNKTKIHPEYLYFNLLSFRGELSAFSNDIGVAMVNYEHMNLTSSLVTLMEELKLIFNKVAAPKYLQFPFVNSRMGIYTTALMDRAIIEKCDLILAVTADMPSEKFARDFPLQSKISNPDKIKELIRSQMPGIPINKLNVVPSEIPYHSDYLYYKIDKTDSSWEDMKAADSISVYSPDSFVNFNALLWVIFNE